MSNDATTPSDDAKDETMTNPETTAPFPAPGRKDGEAPCGECRLKPGETCDICGAIGGRQWVESVVHFSEPKWTVNFLGQHRLHSEDRIVGAVGALRSGKYEGWLWTTPQSTLVCTLNTMEAAREAVLKRYLESENVRP